MARTETVNISVSPSTRERFNEFVKTQIGNKRQLADMIINKFLDEYEKDNKNKV